MKYYGVDFHNARFRALVVDDNTVNRLVLSNMLFQFGIEVEEAISGTQAIMKYQVKDYDLVFMDYLMPDKNGAEVIRELKKLKKPKDTIMIALSANITKELTDLFASAGASHIYKKPLETENLFEIIGCIKSEDNSPNGILAEKCSGEPGVEELGEVLKQVSGLSWEEALHRMGGSPRAYGNVLRVCIGNLRKQKEEILKRKGRPLRESRIYFHSLKGIFANIGAKYLSEEAGVWEAAAIRSEKETLWEQVSAFCDKVDSFTDELDQALDRYRCFSHGMYSKMAVLSQEDFGRKLQKLKMRLAMYEMNEIPSLLEDLMSISVKEKRDKIQEAGQYILEFDYERALETLEGV